MVLTGTGFNGRFAAWIRVTCRRDFSQILDVSDGFTKISTGQTVSPEQEAHSVSAPHVSVVDLRGSVI